MFSFNNDHIFTGYLKQLLSSVNIPTCKIYTSEFLRHLEETGKEDPRVIESFGTISSKRVFANVNYLKNNEICNYKYDRVSHKTIWTPLTVYHYDKDMTVHGITRKLKSLGTTYDTKTHEYLGDFLRFLRDYYDINLMSLYNCFNNKICPNIDFSMDLSVYSGESVNKKVAFDSTDPNFRIYAFPVKLFSKYTIAIDCNQGLELFCGFYKNSLELTGRTANLFNKTYQKVDKAMFGQPFVYDKLTWPNWTIERELNESPSGILAIEEADIISRCDIINREQDLKLFIKVPNTCRSSITVLEGDFSAYNDHLYQAVNQADEAGSNERLSWYYSQNHSVVNFEVDPIIYGETRAVENINKKPALKMNKNSGGFKPISKLQLLAMNTGESYPFADRLVEYLSGSATLPIDGIKDNIKRAQKVMNQNGYFFKTAGLWENQMQKIAYDYMINSGPVVYSPSKNGLVDKRRGIHPRIGHRTKGTLFDVLGYIDKDVEKYYSSWISSDKKAKVRDSIQEVDIYDGLYNI